ncbi:MAG: hypothetical protein R2862_09805 [Thermoanaerobaculia bacterium]
MLEPRILVPLTLFALIGSAPLRASEGTLDPTFADGGRLTIDLVVGGADDSALTLASDSAGRILIGGYSCATDSFCLASVARLLADGTLDPAWNGDGRRLIQFGNGNGVHTATDLLVGSATGPVIVAGRFRDGDDPEHYEIGLAQLLPDGSFDPAFGEAASPGSTSIELPAGVVHQVTSVARTSSGQLLVGGSGESAPGELDVFVARFTNSGQIDSTFGESGVVWLAFGSATASEDLLVSMVALQDDRIVLAAEANDDAPGNRFVVGIARLDADGNFDESFEEDGRRLLEVVPGTNIDDVVGTMVVDPEGRIVLSGASYGPGAPVWFVGRLLADGSTDPTAPFDTLDAGVLGGVLGGYLALDSAGRWLIAGDTYDGDCVVVRYDPATGTLDPVYGSSGSTRFFGPNAESVECVATGLHGGRLLAAGRAYGDEVDDDVFIARLTTALVFQDGFESGDLAGW